MISSIVGIAKIDFRAKSKLSEKELGQYRQLSSLKKKDFLIGRIALKQALANYTSQDLDKKVTIKNSDTGLPYIEGWDNLHCSLSHSYNRGIGVVAPYRVGVDIEKIKPHKKSLLNYIADQEEIDVVQDFFGTQTDVITLIWVIKESVMKGIGAGFSISPKQVKIIRQIANTTFEVKIHKYKSKLWYVWPSKAGSYYIGVAYEKNYEQKPNINWYTGASLSTSRN